MKKIIGLCLVACLMVAGSFMFVGCANNNDNSNNGLQGTQLKFNGSLLSPYCGQCQIFPWGNGNPNSCVTYFLRIDNSRIDFWDYIEVAQGTRWQVYRWTVVTSTHGQIVRRNTFIFDEFTNSAAFFVTVICSDNHTEEYRVIVERR